MLFGQSLIIAISLFLAFSIGLNFGLHGVLSFGSQFPPISMTNMKKTEEAIILLKENAEKNLSLDAAKEVDSIIPTVLKEDTKTETKKNRKLSYFDIINKGSYAEEEIAKISTQDTTKGPISEYLREGKKLPIVILTCNRPQNLEEAISSLLNAKGVTKSDITVSQDGSMKEIVDIVKKYGLRLIQNINGLRIRGEDGGQRIAKHYKYTLTAMFDLLPTTPAVIIVEDDLLFSPDFYDYMHSVAPVLEVDNSLFIISAWNDNGFKGKVNEPYGLMRTDYFPGLGWLLPKRLYKEELESRWPQEHWDHWLRSKSVSKGREIVFPQIPRTYHNGVKGTFMTQETHNKYFQNIDYNRNSDLSWGAFDPPERAEHEHKRRLHLHAIASVYEKRIETLLTSCQHISSLRDLAVAVSAVDDDGGVYCIWINVNPEPMSGAISDFQTIATFFGIWHEHRRAAHGGLHEFQWVKKTHIMLLNTFGENNQNPTYKKYLPAGVSTVAANQFTSRRWAEAQQMVGQPIVDIDSNNKLSNWNTIAADMTGQSCDDVCLQHDRQCAEELLPLINSCEKLEEHFNCVSCEPSVGMDQPAYVDIVDEANANKCLVNSASEGQDIAAFSCSASYPTTKRLCACSQ